MYKNSTSSVGHGILRQRKPTKIKMISTKLEILTYEIVVSFEFGKDYDSVIMAINYVKESNYEKIIYKYEVGIIPLL